MISSFDVEIRILPRQGILNPEGQTIERALGDLGYADARDVTVGRLIGVRLEATDSAAARDRARQMCERLLANPVIEDFEISVAGAESRPGAESSPGAVSGTTAETG